MSPSAVRRAAKQGNQSVTGIAAIATGPDAKCFPQYALSVAKTPKYPLNLAVVDRCIVAIATVKSESANSAGLTLRAYIGREYSAYVCF